MELIEVLETIQEIKKEFKNIEEELIELMDYYNLTFEEVDHLNKVFNI